MTPEIEDTILAMHRHLVSQDQRLSDRSRSLILRDVRRFQEWFHAQNRDQLPYYMSSEAEFGRAGWVECAPAAYTAWERGLSAETATSVLRDWGAMPADACSMDGYQFEAKFGKSWFDILPRVNG